MKNKDLLDRFFDYICEEGFTDDASSMHTLIQEFKKEEDLLMQKRNLSESYRALFHYSIHLAMPHEYYSLLVSLEQQIYRIVSDEKQITHQIMLEVLDRKLKHKEKDYYLVNEIYKEVKNLDKL